VFSVPILAAATTAAVTIAASWTGTEAISTRGINGGPNNILVNIQSQANVVITSVVVSGMENAFPTIGGIIFTVTVTLSNTGGTAATFDAVIDDGAFTGLSWSDPAEFIVNAGGTNACIFAMYAAAAAVNSSVTIAVGWAGIEDISARAMSSSAPVEILVVIVVPPQPFIPSDRPDANFVTILFSLAGVFAVVGIGLVVHVKKPKRDWIEA
jgi:hypothetical protein